jgi:hypothetical protein
MNVKDSPRNHIIREPLPWRSELLTECGRAVDDVASTITREQLVWRVKQYGQQRTAFTVCMTCYQTVNNSPRWDTHPAQVMARYIRSGITYSEYDRTTGEFGPVQVDRLGAELHAIAELIAAHREEFDERVTAASEAALFAHRRRLADRRKA